MKDLSQEFSKLDGIDRKVLFWLLENSPKAVKSWIEYEALNYRTTRSIEIDTVKLYKEVKAGGSPDK